MILPCKWFCFFVYKINCIFRLCYQSEFDFLTYIIIMKLYDIKNVLKTKIRKSYEYIYYNFLLWKYIYKFFNLFWLIIF